MVVCMKDVIKAASFRNRSSRDTSNGESVGGFDDGFVSLDR